MGADDDEGGVGTPVEFGEAGVVVPDFLQVVCDERFSRAQDGGHAVVGAPNDRGPGTGYVFARSGSTWSQQAELTASGSSDGFGWSVALAKPTAVVGAPSGKRLQTGLAHVFVNV
jgi:hypothetical protein